MNKSKKIVHELLEKAGVTINGDHPWDLQVHDERLYDRVLRDASLGLGEAYMDGWWDCEAIDAFIDSLDLVKLGFKHSIPSEVGKPSYNPSDRLKLYVYGYLNQVRSSRKRA